MKHLKTYLLYAMVAIAAALVGYFLSAPQSNPETAAEEIPLEGGTALLHHQRAFPSMNLVDYNGKDFTNARLNGKWSLFFFGYTHCPDICPTTLATMAQLKKLLGESGNDVQIVFVSVDPERDQLEHLKNYVTYFHPDFLGVTGTPANLLELTKPLGIIYRKVQGEGESDYLVDHSANVIVSAPNGDWAAIFRAPHTPEIMFSDLERLKAGYQP